MRAPARIGFPDEVRLGAPTDALDAWSRVRSYLCAVEAGARALRREQERELARHNPVTADAYAAEAKNLERLAAWLNGKHRRLT